MPGRALAKKWPVGAEGKLTDARPGVVRAPLGGSGQTLALTIPTGDELHAHVAGYGLRWPSGTRRDLPAISTLVKVEIAGRSCRCFEAT